MVEIGKDGVFVVAELSCGHNGSLAKALELVEAAKFAGVNAVKTQCYSADTISIKSNHPLLDLVKGTWRDYYLYDLYIEAATPYEWQGKIKEKAESLGLVFFSTPFSESDSDFLESEINPPCYKIASFELIDLPLIEHIARKGKPIILSTGMGSWLEVKTARERIANTLGLGYEDTEFLDRVILLHCVSGYPSPEEEADLGRLIKLGQYGHSIGLSDHSRSNMSSIMAVALGASIIEKHIAVDRSGQDGAFSLLPNEFSGLVKDIRQAERMMKPSNKPSEEAQKGIRPSIWVTKDMQANEQFTKLNTDTLRPSGGLLPHDWNWILEKRAIANIRAGSPLTKELVA